MFKCFYFFSCRVSSVLLGFLDPFGCSECGELVQEDVERQSGTSYAKTVATSRLLIRETPLLTHPLQLSLYQYFTNSQQKVRKSCTDFRRCFWFSKLLNWPKTVSNETLQNWFQGIYIEIKGGQVVIILSQGTSYINTINIIYLYTLW